MYVHRELVLQAEVASAAEAERMICSGITVEGKKCEVRAWTKDMKGKGETAASPKASGDRATTGAPMGRWQAGVPSTTMARPIQGGPHPRVTAPTEPAAMWRSGSTQEGGTTTNGGRSGAAGSAPRWRMLSNVRCYRYGLMGNLQYTCTSPSSRATAGVGNGRGILPVLARMNANQNGERPAADIPLDAKKPAVGDGAKYGKPYWLAELEKVKDRWGLGVGASKSAGEG